MSKFKVGDLIIFLGYCHNKSELGRCQKILNISHGGMIKSVFLDDGSENMFQVDSMYYNECNYYDGNYKNGVPVLWEDEV